MKASKILKKQMLIESIALLFLVFCIIYSYFMITGSKQNVKSQDGMVVVLDDSSFKAIIPHSDGAGFQTDKVTYAVTNNNKEEKTYQIILKTNVKEEDLSYVKVGVDGFYAFSLGSLKKEQEGYILTTHSLSPGFTKVHTFQYWLDKEANLSSLENIEMSYHLKFE